MLGWLSFSFLSQKNDFIKEIKHVLPAFVACWKPRQSLWLRLGISLICSQILSNVHLGFHLAMKGTEKMFYFLNLEL